MSEYQKLVTLQMADLSKKENPDLDEPLKIPGVSSLIVDGLISAGFDTLRKVAEASPQELTSNVPGFNYFDVADKILEQANK